MGHASDGDTEFRDYTLEGVTGNKTDGWVLSFDNGLCFGCPASSPVVPRAGMKIRQFGRGFGYPVRGLFIEGQCVFYRTHAEQDAKQRDDFNRDRPKIDARYDALPACFRRRLDKFRSNNPDFRWKFEGYELFCCEQAVLIADALKTTEAIGLWALADWDEQKRDVPGLSSDHSGNTFGCAVQLARLYLTNQENVVKMHGALAPLVGSKEYGCVPVGAAAGDTP